MRCFSCGSAAETEPQERAARAIAVSAAGKAVSSSTNAVPGAETDQHPSDAIALLVPRVCAIALTLRELAEIFLSAASCSVTKLSRAWEAEAHPDPF